MFSMKYCIEGVKVAHFAIGNFGTKVGFYNKLRRALFLLAVMMPARSLAEFAAGGLSQKLVAQKKKPDTTRYKKSEYIYIYQDTGTLATKWLGVVRFCQIMQLSPLLSLPLFR